MRRFRIGEIVLCKCPDGFLEPGEIVETVTKNGRTEIVVRFPDDKKIWKYETILPEDIVIVSADLGAPSLDLFGKSGIMGTTAYERYKRCLWKRHERIRVGDL